MSLIYNIEDAAGYVSKHPKPAPVRVTQVKPLIKLLICKGVRLEKLLNGSGLYARDLIRRDTILAGWQLQKLLQNAFIHAPDHSFAAQLGEQDFINHDSLLASRIMSCNDADEALRLLANYYSLWTNQFNLGFEVSKQWGIFSVHPTIDFGSTLPFYIEYLYSVLYSNGCFCLDERKLPLIFEFSYPKPNNHDHYARYFSETIRFEQSFNRVLIPRNILKRKLIFADHQLAEANDKNVQGIIQNLQANDLASKTRALIRKLPANAISLEAVASALCMSARSLRRHLKQEHQSFQVLVDEYRHSEAKHRLSTSNPSILELALELGYKDASSFSRAFKRWEGVAPREYQSQTSIQD